MKAHVHAVEERASVAGPRVLGSAAAPRAAVSVLAVALAVLVIGLILIPARAWHHPTTDACYTGFDPNLMYLSPAGPAPNAGQIEMSRDRLGIVATSGSRPTVDLVTTPLSFATSFDVVVNQAPAGSVPLRVEVWSPESGSGYVLSFEPDNGNVIKAETVSGGVPLQDLLGGTVTDLGTLGHFRLGQPYHISLNVDQTNRRVTTLIEGTGVTQANSTIDPSTAPDVFKAFRYALTVSASASSDSSSTDVSNFAISLPPQPDSTAESVVKVDDARARLLTELLLAASILICVAGAALYWNGERRRKLVQSATHFGRWIRANFAFVGLLLGGLGVYLLANAPLFGIASPHYDVWSAKVWAYVPTDTGLADLYYRTLLVPASAAWGGIPLHEAGFPYGFTLAYHFAAAGWLFKLWPATSGTAPVGAFALEALLKALNVVFGFVDGILAYLILRRLVNPQTALTSALLLVVNPAVVLVMSLWGSTETVSLFFVLGSILLAEANRPLGAWLMLAAAAYTRPQMLVLAFLLGAVYLRKFEVARNVRAIAWTVLAAFIAIAPFTLSISPSMPVDYIARTLLFHFGNGQADLPYLGTSPGYYSVWTLPLLVVSGQHGLGRMWSPSTQQLIGSLTYGQIGAASSVLFLLAIGLVILARGSISRRPGQYLPFIALGMLGWLMVTPGLISRYFVYAIVAIILCRSFFTMRGYLWTVSLLTVITCITAYGHLALDFLGYSGSVNLMSPTNNAFSRAVFNLFSADFFITLGALTNIAILVVVGLKAWDSMRGEALPRNLQPAVEPL